MASAENWGVRGEEYWLKPWGLGGGAGGEGAGWNGGGGGGGGELKRE